jgi:hypothetical protein
MERTTDKGREVSTDGGATWLLVEPSPQFDADRAASQPPPEPTPGLRTSTLRTPDLRS